MNKEKFAQLYDSNKILPSQLFVLVCKWKGHIIHRTIPQIPMGYPTNNYFSFIYKQM